VSDENKFPYSDKVLCHFDNIDRRISWESDDIVICA